MRSSDIKKHLSRFRVGIAGAGGLGSNCAAALARSGVGTLVICDFDIVEPANLDRQYYFTSQVGTLKTIALKENIARINPDLVVLAYTEKLSSVNIPAIYNGCDIIVEAFDRDDMKEMIIETVQSEMPGVPIIVGSGVAGWGNSGSVRCRKIDDTLFVCGDESTEVSEEHPLMAPRVGIVANLQADTVIELLMKKSTDYFRQ